MNASLPLGDRDQSMTWSQAVLWLLGGGITLGAGLARDAGFALPGYLQAVGALGMVLGGGLVVAWRGGGVPRRVLGALAYLGTVLVTTAALAGGSSGEVFVPLYGFVAVVAAIHMRPLVAVRHLAVIVAAAGLLVAVDAISLARAGILLSVVLAMAAVVSGVTGTHERAVAEREQQDAWRAAMTGALAHDIRSPLAVVRGVLETLDQRGDRLDEATRHELLATADRHARRVQGLSDDLLAAERVRHGRLELDRSEVAAEDLLGKAAATHGEDVRIDVPDGLVLSVDPQRVSQVLLNLLRNAVVHGEPPVELVARRAEDGGVRLEVRDHGPGVPDDLEQGLFDGFTDGGGQGSVGLGLWIVRLLTEAHAGRVEYEPADPGARFVVWLPPTATSASPSRRGARARPATGTP